MASNSTEIELALTFLRHFYKLGANSLVSTYSVRSALMMLLEGTGGESRAQIARTLFGATFKEEDVKKQVDEFAKANAALLDPRLDLVRIANLLYTHVDFPLHPSFTTRLSDSLKARATVLDFMDAPDQARATINKDVATATSRKIPTLLAHNLDEKTRLVLINALHFKARWADEFKPDKTQEQAQFYLSGQGGRIKVAMMRQRINECPFYYSSKNRTRAIRLAYEMAESDDEASLPMGTFLTSTLTTEFLREILTHLKKPKSRRAVNINVPRFKFTAESRLISVLKSTGIQDIFILRKGDFSKLLAPNANIKSKDLLVSEAIQKALIEVNEEGTEAVAVTMMEDQVGCGPSPTNMVDFVANRPFLFLLLAQVPGDEAEKILFIGAVENPTKES